MGAGGTLVWPSCVGLGRWVGEGRGDGRQNERERGSLGRELIVR